MTALWLLPFLLPLLAGLSVGFGAFTAQFHRARAAFWLMAIAFAGAVAALVHVATGPAIVLGDPSAAAHAWLPLGLTIDRLAAVMMVLISGVGLLIFRYATRYMFQEPGYGRFLALIGITTTVLLSLVASANLVMLFVGWQLLSYLLYQLAHNLRHDATRDGAIRTFRLLRVGDAIFLAGILLAQSLYGTTAFAELFAAARQSVLLSPLPGVTIHGASAVALLVFLGAMSKSAQFPAHVWLPRSLYAPTPVHALLHAGIINACGFLINRLAPLFGHSPATLHLAFVVGLFTTVVGAGMMLVQNDIKRTLGFSTIGQMGYMVMECGLGAFSLAVFHLIAHGLFKASVFLSSGNVIHKARQELSLPPTAQGPETARLSRWTWLAGFGMTLVLPLVIVLVAHGAIQVPMMHTQGAVIFLFFSWMTSSQALLTFVRLREVASWKVSAAMAVTVLVIVFTYMFAATRFDAFLYPGIGETDAFFRAAALPGPIFDGLVALMVIVVVIGWGALYAGSRGRPLPLPGWARSAADGLYVLLQNQLYVDRLAGPLLRSRRARRASREPGPVVAGASLAAHLAAGVVPFALLQGVPGVAAVPWAIAGVAALWLALSWGLLSVTHEAMYGR